MNAAEALALLADERVVELDVALSPGGAVERVRVVRSTPSTAVPVQLSLDDLDREPSGDMWDDATMYAASGMAPR